MLLTTNCQAELSAPPKLTTLWHCTNMLIIIIITCDVMEQSIHNHKHNFFSHT